MRRRLLTLALLVSILPPPIAFAGPRQSSSQLAQSGKSTNARTISGIVSDKSGEPLIGVLVSIQGTQKGVQTGLDGRYSIAIPSDIKAPVLVFQYLGMKDESVKIGSEKNINVILQSDNTLDAATIVGAYGSKQSREDLVGSAFQVSSDQLKNLPKARVEDLLTGLVPGMQVSANADYAGSPRTRLNVRVRGSASLNASNEPLWIIDGVPVYTGGHTNSMPGMSYTVSPLSLLNPDDIESMTVLKDADQTSIYGANGSNGVVIITTKSAKFDTPLRISASLSYGISTPDYSTMFKMMNAEQYMEVAKEAWVNGGNSLSSFAYNDNPYNSYSTTSTDWARLYLKAAPTTNLSISMRNGTRKMANTISFSYYEDKSIQQSNHSRRFTFNERNDLKITDKISLDFNINASYTTDDIFAIGRSYIDNLPIFEPFNPDDSYRLYNYLNYYVDEDGIERYTRKKFFDNDIPEARESGNTQRTMVTAANARLRIQLFKGLELSSQFKLNYQHSHEDAFDSIKTLSGINDKGEPYGAARRADCSYANWTNINQLNFDHSWGNFRINAMGVLELRSHTTKTLSASGSGFINDYIQEMSYLDKAQLYTNSSTTVTRNLSYFGRLEMNYRKRYYLSANFRRDGASDFGKYAQWGNFWSAGLSWNIHNEDFFESSVIDMLKFKASIGDNGNSRTGSSSFEGTWVYSSSTNYGGKTGSTLGTVANPYLSWEKTRNLNSSVRIEMLERRLNFELEAYLNRTRDLISKVYTSRTISSERLYANVGNMQNAGVEFSLESVNIKNGDFIWSTKFNIAHNDNRITELYNGMKVGYDTTVDAVGHPRQAHYLVRWAGVDPSDGSPMWYDLDGNVTKTYNSANRVIIDGQEIAFGGLSNDFSYGPWTLGIQINYNIGGLARASYADNYMADGYDIINGNQAVEVYYYRWKKPGDVTGFPKVTTASTGTAYSCTRYLFDKTSFDLYNVSLSYQLPDRLLEQLKLSAANLTLAGNNLYFFTPHQSKDFNSYKTMAFGYPRVRRVTLSLNISF